MVKYVLFDLDGTLTDSEEGITKSVAKMLQTFGIETENLSDLRKFIGPPLRESLKKFNNFTDEQCDVATLKYREIFAISGWKQNKVYDGIEKMLKYLQDNGKKLLLATSKPEDFADKIMKYFKLESYFDFICGSDLLFEKRKTKADVVKFALDNIAEKYGNFSLDEVIMVGDRLYDILGAREHNVETIGVTFGFGGYDELKEYGAKYIVNSPAELTDLLLKI